ncbi:SDR family NAD(P)-dependent oxidoreductase [Kribbella sp. NPDC048928]|uniref:SDR family NAD(P)-dependent oxidoreductase n=1 Tax=Kribbella sp. NPDC048928 TaxID=3364111 RepID=UPI003714D5E6
MMRDFWPALGGGPARSPLRRILIWISGASAGLGAALAATIPFEGAELVDISRRGGVPGAQHVAVDLADPESWPVVEKDFRQRIEAEDPDLVVFIHTAGAQTPAGPADLADPAQYTRSVLLNSAAAQVLGHSFLGALSGSDCEQHLIMVSPGDAYRPQVGESTLGAGKAAIDQWVRSVGLEQQRRSPGCRVISVAPGPLDRFESPDSVARAIWGLLEQELDSGTVLHLREVT